MFCNFCRSAASCSHSAFTHFSLIKNSTEIFCNFKKRVLKIFGIRNKIFSLQKIKKHSTQNSKKLRNWHAVYPKFCRFFWIFPILFLFLLIFFQNFSESCLLNRVHSKVVGFSRLPHTAAKVWFEFTNRSKLKV